MQRITFSTHTTFGTSPRYTQFNGRDYLIASCVGIVEGVLNGRLVLAEEFGKFPEVWNNIPIPVYHPERNGQPVSANSPDILENEVIGYFFNTYIENQSLKGEMWIDIKKCTELGDEALDILQRLENHQVIEVSTGFFHDEELRSGTFKNERYTSICRNIRPDHIAVLPNAIGACSIEDGCGVSRNQQEESPMSDESPNEPNCECNDQQPAQPDTAVRPEVNREAPQFHDSVMVALYLPQPAQDTIANTVGDFPAGSTAIAPTDYHVTLAYLGKTDQFTAERRLEITQAIDSFAYHTPSFSASLSGTGRFLNAENELDAVHLITQSDVLYVVRNALVDYLDWYGVAVSRANGFVPHVTLAYVPNGAAYHPAIPNINKIAFPHISLSWGDEVTRFALQGELSVQNLSVNQILEQIPTPEVTMSTNTQEQEEQELIDEVEGTDATATETAEGESTPTPPEGNDGDEDTAVADAGEEGTPETFSNAVAQAVEAGIQAALSPYLPVLQSLQTNRANERNATINALVQNERCALTADQLAAMNDDTLNAVASSFIEPSYAGQALQPFVNSEEITAIDAPSLWS